MNLIDGGIASPRGFRAAAAACGVKKNGGLDVALVYSVVPAVVAAQFTTNQVKAAPVLWSQRRLSNRTQAQAIVVNSGNANACTGETGMEHAIDMCERSAKFIGLATEDVLVASTGVIGVELPIAKVRMGIESAASHLDSTREASAKAAQAICTTDTCTKECAVTLVIDGQLVTIAGMAKGSGMIHPNMATMLAFVTTDANVGSVVLSDLLTETVTDTYNMITVDGDTSTNDSVFVLANGLAGNHELTPLHDDFQQFREAFRFVHQSLAKQIVMDGEGATKFLEVRLTGAVDNTHAKRLVKSVLTSSLVKTAFFGADANWGRILAAMGYSGASFGQASLHLAFESANGRIVLMDEGEAEWFDEQEAKSVLGAREIVVDIRLQDGTGEAIGWGCDLSYDYVRINGDYRT